MSAPVTLLVTGSRALAETPEARWWATQHLLRALADLPLGSAVVTGDASGPDVWTAAFAHKTGSHPVGIYTRWGQVRCPSDDSDVGRLIMRWMDAAPKPTTREEWRTRLLARDRAMVAWVSEREGERRCLALIAPWSTTGGTAYTARHAREAGIVVMEHVCPVEYGPGGVR